MRKLSIVLCVLSLIVAFPLRAQEAQDTGPDDRQIDLRLFREVAANAVSSLDLRKKAVDAADRMASEGKDKATAGFVAAKVAWLANKPSTAIHGLESVVQGYGKQGSNQEFRLPVVVVGNFWIGTIARHYGDAGRARRAYEDILAAVDGDQSLKGLSAFCYLYLGEIDAAILGKPADAAKVLGRMEELKPPPSPEADQGSNLYKDWAKFLAIRFTAGAEKANAVLEPNSYKSSHCVLTAISLLEVNGVLGQPRVDFYNDEKQALFTASLEEAVENRTSGIDRGLAQLVMADVLQRANQPEKAEHYYRNLLDGGSFFAPEGGIFLATSQSKRGKADEGEKTLLEVKQRFPGYAELVDGLRAQPTAANPPATPSAK